MLKESLKKEVLIYQDAQGREPLTQWLEAIKDKKTALRIRNRLRRIELGNLGHSKSLGEGVHELKLSFGPGYRVYFGTHGPQVVILLCAGDKHSQAQDIKRAKKYWKDYQEAMLWEN